MHCVILPNTFSIYTQHTHERQQTTIRTLEKAATIVDMLNRKENTEEAIEELRRVVDEYKTLSKNAESSLASYRPKPHRALVYNSKKEELALKLMSRRVNQALELLRDCKDTLN